MDANDFKKYEAIAIAQMDSKEQTEYNNLSQDEKERYVQGFKDCIDEYVQVKTNSQNNSGGQQNGEQAPEDGLDHWVSKQQEQEIQQQNRSQSKTNDVDLDNKTQDNKDSAQDANDSSNDASQASQEAMNERTADSAQKAANAAQNAANKANQAAKAAQETADAAQQLADIAKEQAEQSGKPEDQDTANKAQKAADNAKQAAQESQEAANAAQDAANAAQEAADRAKNAEQNGNKAESQRAAQEAAQAAQEAANQTQTAGEKSIETSSEALDAAKQVDKQNGQSGQQDQNGQSGQSDQSSQSGQSGQDDQSGQQNQSGKDGQDGQDDNITEEPEIDMQGSMNDILNISNDLFPTNGMSPQELMKKIAEEAGQPLDADDFEDVIESQESKFNEVKGTLKSLGGKGVGNGNSLLDLVNTITELFKTTLDWKSALKRLFNSLSKGDSTDVMAKRRMGVDPNHPLYKGRYLHPNEEPTEKVDGLVQVFFLIDNSGSMGHDTASGKKHLAHLFSEIIELEKKTNIKKSAIAYFAAGPIQKSQIRTWTDKEIKNVKKLLDEKINRQKGDNSGGTSVNVALDSIMQLGKPYYNKNKPATLLIVVTDGYDSFEVFKNLSPVQKFSTIFIVMNTGNYLEDTRKALIDCGIKKNHILLADTKEWE